jgi:hypothetical protein
VLRIERQELVGGISASSAAILTSIFLVVRTTVKYSASGMPAEAVRFRVVDDVLQSLQQGRSCSFPPASSGSNNRWEARA